MDLPWPVVRAVSGERPASSCVDNAARLESMCERPAQAKRVDVLLHAKGLDPSGLPIDEALVLVLELDVHQAPSFFDTIFPFWKGRK